MQHNKLSGLQRQDVLTNEQQQVALLQESHMQAGVPQQL